MRTSLLIVVPCILLGGLIYGAIMLGGLQKTAACEVGSCPLSLHESDAGKTFVYGPSTRFTVYLDATKNPETHLTCAPDGIVRKVSDSAPAQPPLYAAIFETMGKGTCKLSSDHFAATIIVNSSK